MLEAIYFAGSTIFIYMTIMFILALGLKRNDIADVAWGLGFIITSWLVAHKFNATADIQYAVLLLVTLWGIRLAVHIFSRSKGKPEDFRYKKWRDDWGKYFVIRSYLQVFLLQGLFMLVILLPVIEILSRNGASLENLALVNTLGLVMWGIGFFFEAIGDHQLVQFKKNPANKGKIMKTGLWKYTRHPNYFGEVSMWWGIWLLTLPIVSVYGWVSLIGPLTITFLILFVSGIPMLERKYEGNKEFEEYKRKTSVFVPLPPRK